MNWTLAKKEGQPDLFVERIKLSAVHSSESQEDQSFSAATPSGTLEITVTNPAVHGQFQPGQFFYLDLIPAQ
jgi:hypothetical protein